jgi:hypothetical protein
VLNPLATREQLIELVNALLRATEEHFSPGRSRLRFGVNSAHFSSAAAEVEGFCRLLWAVVPLVCSGAECKSLALLQEGLANGTDPENPEFWGMPTDYNQRLVDAAAIGYALAVAPAHFWHCFSPKQQENIVAWLGAVNSCRVYDNNWLFFRVMANLGLRCVGASNRDEHTPNDLAGLHSFAAEDGWYSDGRNGPVDYYNSFVFHYYGLIYSRVVGADDRHSRQFLERATRFARTFVQWFSSDGCAIPYGRSLTYRFAQAAFWSALPMADLEALPWAQVKGLVLRHLRWWFMQPILTHSGLLTVGYSYPNTLVAEQYISPASPYWAMKGFAALAADATHPFWTSSEEPLPRIPAISVQPAARVILCRDGEHVFALSAGQPTRSRPRHGAEKYSKFCYSSHFGFSLPSACPGPEFAAPDNTLALTEDGEWLRGPSHTAQVTLSEEQLAVTWSPWPWVKVITWLIPCPPWHVRVHCILTERKLSSVEGGFSVNRDDDPLSPGRGESLDRLNESGPGCAIAASHRGLSAIRACTGIRQGFVLNAAPNTNVLFPRSAIPLLVGDHVPGEHWLVCMVAAWAGSPNRERLWSGGPSCRVTSDSVLVCKNDGSVDVAIAKRSALSLT